MKNRILKFTKDHSVNGTNYTAGQSYHLPEAVALKIADRKFAVIDEKAESANRPAGGSKPAATLPASGSK